MEEICAVGVHDVLSHRQEEHARLGESLKKLQVFRLPRVKEFLTSGCVSLSSMGAVVKAGGHLMVKQRGNGNSGRGGVSVSRLLRECPES